jgi:hypothetical protein
MKGKRVYLNKAGELLLASGDYGKDVNGDWLARPPVGHTGSLIKHTVIEHEDGKITVSPSILITDNQNSYHGYLERGIWREI